MGKVVFKKPGWRLMILSAIALALIALLIRSPQPPLAKAIGLPIEDKKSEDLLHTVEVALVYSKSGVNFDLYDHIRAKATGMYGAEKFQEGVETKGEKGMDSGLIADQYKNGRRRSFEIESRDQYSCIWIIEYENHVAVLLRDWRY